MEALEIEREISDAHYRDVLDDIYGDINVCGIKYSSGRALECLDPVAFRCGKHDYESELGSQWQCVKCDTVHSLENEANACCENRA